MGYTLHLILALPYSLGRISQIVDYLALSREHVLITLGMLWTLSTFSSTGTHCMDTIDGSIMIY